MKTLTNTDKEFVCDIEAPCFQALSPEEIEAIKSSRIQVFFHKGENLTKQGVFATFVLFVTKGFVKQHVEGDGQHKVNLRIVGQGEFLGLSSAFDHPRFLYSSVALTEAQAFLIEKDTIIQMIKQNGTFAYNIMRRYCAQTEGLFNLIKNQSYKQINGRMADTLLYMQPANFNGEDVTALLTRRDIAEFAGVSMESAVKILKAFEKDGLLKLDEKQIIILQPDALAEISKRG
ncbi:MAG: Crp/Fnr family transcriptional regulator [Bacteroidetes bacterium]|nr:Crp/Fnr family transcriptional regulator [Bacteroidota bacterium]MBU1719723.1 Crp/Fnr family transcriptional regulator [Bacteroidota bacterium]